MSELSAGVIYAYLSSTWTNINAEVLASNVKAGWGINGNGPLENLADAGKMNFTLSNRAGYYAPDSATALADWGKGTPIKLVLSYDGTDYIRFYGRVDTLNIRNGKSVNDNFVDVIVLDWMDYANKYPMISLTSEANKRANQSLNTIIAAMPIKPLEVDFAHGLELFPAVFDSATLDTRAYTEFNKLVKSELGYMYLRKPKTTGERLVFEAADTRNGLRALTNIPTLAPADSYLLMETGDFLLLEIGDKIILDVSSVQAASITTDIMDASMRYGDAIINRATVQAFPKKVDVQDTVLYSLPTPLPIASNETITFRAQYTDPTGGNKINAQTSTMITPTVAGGTDPYLSSLLHFNGADASGTFTDETGKTWTAHNGAVISTSVSRLGGGVGSFSGTNEYIDTPSHAAFEFGNGDFTVEWFAYLKDAAAGDATLARDGLSTYPAWAFGVSDGANLDVYLTSTGTSWNASYPKTFGKVSLNSWVHYAITREGNVFRTFRDGQLQDSWQDSITLVTSIGSPAIARYNTTKYQFVYIDELRITKGKARYINNFTPTAVQFTATLPGDYLANTRADGSGTNLTSSIIITAVYGSESVIYTLQNSSATDGFITYLTARGRGVYQYNPVEISINDSVSISTYGYQDIRIDQQYQQNLIGGTREANKYLDIGKNPRTNLREITMCANRSTYDMLLFLSIDVGDLIQITETSTGINSRYYVQSVSFDILSGGIIMYTLGVQQAWSLTHGLTAMAADFNSVGTTDALDFGNVPQANNLQYITINVWIYATNAGGAIIGKYTDFAGWVLLFTAGDAFRFVQFGTSDSGGWNTTETIAEDAWHMITVTRDTTLAATDPIIYIDGVAATVSETDAQAGSLQDDSLCNMLLGNVKTLTQDYTSPFIGKIKDARVYNRILTQAEITALNAAGAYDMTNTSGLVFQAPCVRTNKLTYFTDHTLLSGDRMIDNIYSVVGASHGSVISRTV